MNKVTKVIASAATGAGALLASVPAMAADPTDITSGLNTAKGTGSTSDLGTVISIISNTAFGLVGALAVLFLIMGGISYVTSQGDPKKTATAKDTILYAIIGVVVVIVAYALVQFVVNQFLSK